jgi:Flp pilus assembly protein TadB
LLVLRIPVLLKFFVGVVLVQGMTGLLLYAWSRTGSADAALTFVAIGLAAGFFASLWVASLSRSDRREAQMRAESKLAQERERHKRLSEKARVKAADTARKEGQREARRGRAGANIKLGGAVAGMVGLGVLLLLTQFLSLGVLLVSSSGGAVAGYLFRARQEARRKPGQGGALTSARVADGSRYIESEAPKRLP